MLSSGKIAFSSFVLFGVVLGGCQFLKKSGGDAADAAAEAAAPVVADTSDAAAVDDAGATTVTTTPTAVTRIVPRGDGGAGDGGVGDAGAALSDAGAGDAGAPQECCCQATGFPLQSVAMSECNKTRKGQCVKKEQCAVVDAGAAPAPTPTALEPQSCCCDAAGTKKVLSQKECTTTKKGQCVPLAQCGLNFKRPGQK